MTSLGLRLPIDIPWKRIGVSMHMMDRDVCDKDRPVAMQPSVAIFSYEPDDTLDVGDKDVKVSYLKVTCSVSSYGATNLDRLRKGRRIVASPYYDFVFSGSSYEARQTDQFDSSQQITGADLPCFGALLEVSVGPSSGDWTLPEYPYFSDFDPKKRELYELVSDTGEMMSRSLEQTGVLHGGTTSSTHEVFDKDTVGVTASSSTHDAGAGSSSVGGSYSSESGSRNVDSASYNNVRTVDGARESRETYSHTTQISQMYQLLTSFHLGTNRAVFFFEPRPHIVQRDRTFVDGPRNLEGIQEFFLVVVRPRKMASICVNASLETLHVGAILDPASDPVPPTATLVFPRIGLDGAWDDPDEDKTFPAENTVTYTAPDGYIIDQFKEMGGYSIDKLDQKGHTNYKIEVTSTTVTIWGHIDEYHIEGSTPWEKDRRDEGHLEIVITIYLKPKVSDARVKQFAILTDTSVCTCPSSHKERLSEVDHGHSIVRELTLPQTERRIGRPMSVQAAHDWHKFFGSVVRSSMSSPDRYPKGKVGFWDLDVMKEPLGAQTRSGKLASASLGEFIPKAELRSSKLDEDTRAYLARPEVAKKPVAEILRPSLRDFVERSGLDFNRAAALRKNLWERVATTGGHKSRDRER